MLSYSCLGLSSALFLFFVTVGQPVIAATDNSGTSDHGSHGVLTLQDVRDFAVEDVQQLLNQWGLSPVFADSFRRNHINGDFLLEISAKTIDEALFEPSAQKVHWLVLYRRIKEFKQSLSKAGVAVAGEEPRFTKGVEAEVDGTLDRRMLFSNGLTLDGYSGLRLRTNKSAIVFGSNDDVYIKRTGSNLLEFVGDVIFGNVTITGTLDAASLLSSGVEANVYTNTSSNNCKSVNTTSAQTNGGTFAGAQTTNFRNGDFIAEADIEECDEGFIPNSNLIWECASHGGIAYASDQFCIPNTCSSGYTTEAEVHGGIYQGDIFDVSITTGDPIPPDMFLATVREATCLSGFNASENVVWICPNEGGVAYPSEYFCHGERRCYSVDLSGVETFDDSIELSYDGGFPVYDGDRITDSSIIGISDDGSCIFAKADWICEEDGGTAVPETSEICSDHCEDLLNPPHTVGSIYNDNVLDGVYFVLKVDEYLLATSRTSETFTVIDVSDPTDPLLVGILQMPSEPFHIAVHPDHQVAFISLVSGDGFLSVNISDIRNPSIITSVSSSSNLDGTRQMDFVWPEDGRTILVLACSTDDEYTAYDVTDPASPTFVSSVSNLDGPWGVKNIGDNILWVSASSNNGISFIDASVPEDMTVLSKLTSSTYYDNSYNFFQKPGTNYGYVNGHGDDLLSVIDISDLSNPSLVSSVSTGDKPMDFSLIGEFIIMTIGETNDGIEAYDISDPTNPSRIYAYENVPALDGAAFFALDGRYMYIPAYNTAGIVVMQIC